MTFYTARLTILSYLVQIKRLIRDDNLIDNVCVWGFILHHFQALLFYAFISKNLF